METSQEDILQSTKTVIQGLDALKNEHGKILESLVEAIRIDSASSSTHSNDLNKLEEKTGLLRKSMDMIDLGKDCFRSYEFTSSSLSKMHLQRYRRSSSNDAVGKSFAESRSGKAQIANTSQTFVSREQLVER